MVRACVCCAEARLLYDTDYCYATDAHIKLFNIRASRLVCINH